MPVRFQVDPDFYDHPKSIGMSDAAVALWTRAGSYSAAKLTDGFIAEHVLVTLSRTPDEASAELVARGLWRRVKGGFRFHQWDHRNLTRGRVQADREYDRKRKRERRKRPVDNQNAQANPPNVPPDVRPDSGRTPNGIHPLSVSVSVSESVSASGHGARASPPTAAAAIIIDALEATPDEAERLAARIEHERRPRNLPGLVNALAKGPDLAAMLAEQRDSDGRGDTAAAIARARQGPPCRHGDPGGATPHPVSGQPLCPLCRRTALIPVAETGRPAH